MRAHRLLSLKSQSKPPSHQFCIREAARTCSNEFLDFRIAQALDGHQLAPVAVRQLLHGVYSSLMQFPQVAGVDAVILVMHKHQGL